MAGQAYATWNGNMSTTGPRSQIPLNRAIVDNNGMLTVPWSFWFQSQNAGLPPAGAGYVIDGSASQVTMTLFQGVDSQKGTPQNGYIFFALDTNKTYVSVANQWVLQDPAYSGDVTKSAGSTVLSLQNVFGSPGTYGSSTQTPVITIDSKGRITGLSLQNVVATPQPAGSSGEIQFNNGGILGGTLGVTYSVPSQSLVFANPQATINNLSPLIAKGDIMTRDTANTTRLPVGINGQILIADSAANVGLTWIDHNYIANGTSNVIIPIANSNIEVNVNGNLVGIFYDTGLSVFGNVSAPLFEGDILANIVNANVIIGNTIDISGNANLGNVFTNEIYANLIDVTGNITANYAIFNEVISNTANIAGNAIIGNISTDSIIANTANISGNVNAGNIFTDLMFANIANIAGNIDIGGNINYDRTFGCFHKIANVTAANANVVFNFDWFANTTPHVDTNGVTVTSLDPTHINIDKSGSYSVFIEMQAKNTDNQDRTVWIWLAKNGTDIPETTIKIVLLKQWQQVIAKLWLLENIVANDYFEVRFAVDDISGISLEYNDAQVTPFAYPAQPSATITILPVGA